MRDMYLERSTSSNIHRQWEYQNPLAGPYGSAGVSGNEWCSLDSDIMNGVRVVLHDYKGPPLATA
jgi:hypothetical protein